jgi:hypothetical protein
VIPLATIESYASQRAGVAITISCDPRSSFAVGVEGTVYFDEDGRPIPVIHLPVDTCSRLEHSDRAQTIIPADWLTLEHEATHIRLASTDECLVETTALANTWQLLRLFRLAAWRAQAIVAGLRYADAQLLPIYRSCRPGVA